MGEGLRFQFGRFELDLTARELRKDRVRLRIQDQPFEVLAMLLERPGDLLSRDDLRWRLWPDGTFVDFEHGVNAAVKRLRRTLGDSANKPRFIETIPRRGYRFVAPVEQIGERPSTPARRVEAPRLAVLPFTSIGGGDTDYLAEGVRDELITRLGQACAGGVAVIARTSSEGVRVATGRIRDLRSLLRVDYVVHGRVRREGDRVRITAQLIDADRDLELWAESYERHLSDCLSVETEVAARIGESLALELLPAPRRNASPARTTAEARDAYLKGRYHWNRPGPAGFSTARSYFDEAIRLDPNFAAALSSRARLAVAVAVDYSLSDPRPALESARLDAERALALEPGNAGALLTLAEASRVIDRNWSRADQQYRAALAANPSSEATYRYYAMFLAARGQAAAAEAAAEKATSLDPMCLVVNTSVAWVWFLLGRYDRAIARCRYTLDLEDTYVPARRLLVAALTAAGCANSTGDDRERLVAAELIDPVTLGWLAHSSAAAGDRQPACRLLEVLEHRSRDGYVSAYHRAVAHAGLGDSAGAVLLLEDAFERCDPAVINVAVDPRFAPLSSHPRFRALVDRLQLTK